MNKKNLAILVMVFVAPLVSFNCAYAADWGPAVGSALPGLEANDHTGAARNLENLAGKKGLLLFLNRSADW